LGVRARSSRYVIENANYLNYSKDRYKLAPGNVEYPTGFLKASNRLLNDSDLDELNVLILTLVRKLHRQITEASDEESKHWAPKIGKENCCPNCNINHEVRDFIRALLLRVIDTFETYDGYLRFLAENESISNDYVQLDRAVDERESKRTLQLDTRNRQLGIGTTVLRILSIKKDIAKDKQLFLAINKDRRFVCGTIDKSLVTDEMAPDSMLECLTTDIADAVEGIYIGLSKQTDDFVRVIADDSSFPKLRDLICKIRSILQPEQENMDDYIVEGVIIQDPELVTLNQNEIGTKVLL
jgi:hypothetical protein